MDNLYPLFVRVFLRLIDVCVGLFDSKEFVVVGVRAAGDAVRWIDALLQWAEHCLNKIVDGEQKRVFNAKAFRSCNFSSVEQVMRRFDQCGHFLVLRKSSVLMIQWLIGMSL